MKKIFLSLLLILLAIPAFAGTKLVQGTLYDLKGLKEIPISVSFENAVYGKAGNLSDFLDKATRDSDWETKSLNCLYQKADAQLGEYGVRLIGAEKPVKAPLYLLMKVNTISKGGDIKGEILLMQNGQEAPLAVIEFSSDDSDDDDAITFRDQFRSVGKSLGKLIVKQVLK